MKRKVIGVSDFPKPYENKDIGEIDSQKYISERRRKRSAESAAYSNLYNQTSARLRDSQDPLIERVKQVPQHIADSQKLLKTSIFQLKSPQYPTKCLILNIYKIKYDKRSGSPPPLKCQNYNFTTSQQFKMKSADSSENSMQFQDQMLDPASTIPKAQLDLHKKSFSSPSSILAKSYPAQSERFKIQTQNSKLDQVPENTTVSMHNSEILSSQGEKKTAQAQEHRSLELEMSPISKQKMTMQKQERTTQTKETQLLEEHNNKILKTHEIQTQTEVPDSTTSKKETPVRMHESETQTYEPQPQNNTTQTQKSFDHKQNTMVAIMLRKNQVKDKEETEPEMENLRKMNTGHEKMEISEALEEGDSIKQKRAAKRSATNSIQAQSKAYAMSQFEKFNVQTPSTWKLKKSDDGYHVEQNGIDNRKSQTLTPRSRSKYEHLIKNLKESHDDNLVIYKVFESTQSKPSTIPVTPYKEPKDKYTIEYLWNIGATNFQTRRPTKKCR